LCKLPAALGGDQGRLRLSRLENDRRPARRSACAARRGRNREDGPTIRTTRAFVGGRSQVVACESYDRGLDGFVAASPAALGINDSS
jgi:hypothetical protein